MKLKNWFNKVIDRKYVNRLIDLAEAYLKLGCYQQAGEAISAVLEIEPQNSEAKRLHEVIMKASGDSKVRVSLHGGGEPGPRQSYPRSNGRWLLALVFSLATLFAAAQTAGGNPPDFVAKAHAQTADGQAVQVLLTEFDVDIPVTALPAGQVAFRVTNGASVEHIFELVRDGRQNTIVQSISLQPGETRNFLIELKPGEYLIYCPVPGMGERGYPHKITVS